MYLKSQGIQDDDGFFGPNVKRHHLKGRAGTLRMFFLPKSTHGPWKSTTQDASWHQRVHWGKEWQKGSLQLHRVCGKGRERSFYSVRYRTALLESTVSFTSSHPSSLPPMPNNHIYTYIWLVFLYKHIYIYSILLSALEMLVREDASFHFFPQSYEKKAFLFVLYMVLGITLIKLPLSFIADPI